MTTPTPTTATTDVDPDRDLLDRWIHASDRGALESLFVRHVDAAQRVALAIAPTAQDADDAVQTAFMRVMDRARQFSATGSVRAWIVGIVANEARMVRRSSRARQQREQDRSRRFRAVPVEAREIDPDAQGDAALRALAALDEPYRSVISEHVIAGVPVIDIAATRRVSANTVHSQLRRGLERLRERCGRRGLVKDSAGIVLLLALWRPDASASELTERMRDLAHTRPRANPLAVRALVGVAVAGVIAAWIVGVLVVRGHGSAPTQPAISPVIVPLAVKDQVLASPPPDHQPTAAWSWRDDMLPEDAQVVLSVDAAALRSLSAQSPDAKISPQLEKMHKLASAHVTDAEWAQFLAIAHRLDRIWIAGDENRGLFVLEGSDLTTHELDVAAAIADRAQLPTHRDGNNLALGVPDEHGELWMIELIDARHIVVGQRSYVDAALARRERPAKDGLTSTALVQFRATDATAQMRCGLAEKMVQGLGLLSARFEMAFDLTAKRVRLSSTMRCGDAAQAAKQAESFRGMIDQGIAALQNALASSDDKDFTPDQRQQAVDVVAGMGKLISIKAEGADVGVVFAPTPDDFAALALAAMRFAQ